MRCRGALPGSERDALRGHVSHIQHQPWPDLANPVVTAHARTHARTHARIHPPTQVFTASWTAVVRYHGPRPTPRANHVWVSNHTSMIDYMILCAYAPFAVIMQLHPGWVGFLQTQVLDSLGCLWFNRTEVRAMCVCVMCGMCYCVRCWRTRQRCGLLMLVAHACCA